MHAAAIEIVPCPSAPAGSADPTRRWALRRAGGRERFAGVTRIEGGAAAPVLEGLGADDAELALVEIALPVVVSDGAGPYLLDADGRITLVLAAHPAIRAAHVAMGAPSPLHRLGVVGPVDGPVWRWLARVEVDADGRVGALDALDACPDLPSARRWASGWRG